MKRLAARRAAKLEEANLRRECERVVRIINSVTTLEELRRVRAGIETSGIYAPTVAALLEVVNERAFELAAAAGTG